MTDGGPGHLGFRNENLIWVFEFGLSTCFAVVSFCLGGGGVKGKPTEARPFALISSNIELTKEMAPLSL